MKKLIMLACLAGAMCAFSDDAAPKAADAAFRELSWIGFISPSKKVSSWYLDEFHLNHAK